MWQERGNGEIRIKQQDTAETKDDRETEDFVYAQERTKSRIVMRSKGNLRLLLNTNININMKVTDMGNKAVCFCCCNAANSHKTVQTVEGDSKEDTNEKKEDSAKSYAVRFRDNSNKEEFRRILDSEIKKMEKYAECKVPNGEDVV